MKCLKDVPMGEQGSGLPLGRKQRETHSGVLHEVTQSLGGCPHPSYRAGAHPEVGANGYLKINYRTSSIGLETIGPHTITYF